jgi:hypothetical protein
MAIAEKVVGTPQLISKVDVDRPWNSSIIVNSKNARFIIRKAGKRAGEIDAQWRESRQQADSLKQVDRNDWKMPMIIYPKTKPSC